MELLQENDEDNPRGEIAIWGVRYFYQDGIFYKQNKETMKFNPFDLLAAHTLWTQTAQGGHYNRAGPHGQLLIKPYDQYMYMYSPKGELVALWAHENIRAFFLALKGQAPAVARKIREVILATARNADG
jgi:hypothetical protein